MLKRSRRARRAELRRVRDRRYKERIRNHVMLAEGVQVDEAGLNWLDTQANALDKAELAHLERRAQSVVVGEAITALIRKSSR
jgi:hypothetical protein